MRDLNPRDFHLRVFETRALGRYANPPSRVYVAFELLILISLANADSCEAVKFLVISSTN